MDGNLMGVLIIGIITWGIYRLFELYARRKERLTMIEKMGTIQMNPSDMENMLGVSMISKLNNLWPSSWPLRISLLLIGIGIGALCAFTIQYAVLGERLLQTRIDNDWEYRNNLNGFKEMIYFSSISVFGGIGLLVAYLIEMKNAKNNKIENK